MSSQTLVTIIVLTLFMVSSLDEVQCFSPAVNQVECNYEDYDDACNHMCTAYDYEDENDPDDTCSHNEFIDPAKVTPIQDLERYKGVNVPLCCDRHHYLLKDNCKDRFTHDEFVCGKPQNAPQDRSKKVENGCPENCTAYGLRGKKDRDGLQENRFNITSDGTMCLLDKDTNNCSLAREVIHYCLFHHCNAEDLSWEVRAHACECAKVNLSQDVRTAQKQALADKEA